MTVEKSYNCRLNKSIFLRKSLPLLLFSGAQHISAESFSLNKMSHLIGSL